MSYQVLARKWRPQRFEDVVGQEHITRTLQNAIETKRLAHAFLFSGPRGVGKTTTARILAKALNCAEGPTPTPCGKCSSCIETTAGTSVDVIEIDGASNRGIEHIRELREAVRYAPAGGKHKVYVIDEVHMLTNEAFNALLKTLEEPPPHVIFLFATTEPQKVPATIHSRCQRYGFKRIALSEIIAKLRAIAGQEGITISDQGLGMIARAAEGSMRDAQSLLDQAVSYSGAKVLDEDLQVVLGAVPQATLSAFLDGLLERDAARLLRQVDDLMEHGQDMRLLLAGVVEQTRNLLIAKASSEPGRIIELPAADIETIKTQAARAEQGHLLTLFDTLSRTYDELRRSAYQRFTLEVGLIKACNMEPLAPLAEILERLDRFAEGLRDGTPPGTGGGPMALQVREQRTDYKARPERQDAGPAGDPWTSVMEMIREKRPPLASLLEHSRIAEQDGESVIVSLHGSGFQMEQAQKKENRDLVEQIAATVFGRKVAVRFQHVPVKADSKDSRTARGTKKKPAEPPDQSVQDVLNVFGGEVIDPDST